MSTVIKTLDPKKVLQNFAGIPLINVHEGTFLEVEFEEAAFTFKVGATGTPVRIMKHNMMAKVTVTLMPQAQENDALSAIFWKDRSSGEGMGIFSAKELNGTSTVLGEGSIEKLPSWSRGDDAEPVKWTFILPDATVFIGGLLT
jgi:hypothetical protein